MDTTAPQTVPPLQIRVPKNLNASQSAFNQDNSDDDLSTGASDELSSSIDKEELETYQDDSNSHFDEYDQDENIKQSGKGVSFMKGAGDMDDHESDDHEDPDMNSDSEDVDVAGPNLETPLIGNTKQPSLYLLENAKKKIILKDGKLVAARQKAQRKDKGVSENN